MRAFPDIFAALFTSTTTVSPLDVLECLKIPQNLSEADMITIPCLRQFITEASEEGIYKYIHGCIYLYCLQFRS